MADGHLNKCKSCCKAQAKERHRELKLDPDWLNSERKRGREKYHRLGYKDLHKPKTEQRAKAMRLYRNKYPEKQKAKNLSQRIPVPMGMERHHWSYAEEDAKDIIAITPQDHATIHRFLEYDQGSRKYRDFNGNLLDTREKHEEYLRLVLAISKAA